MTGTVTEEIPAAVAVLTRVKELEEFLGAPLFHRSTRVVRLSDVGQAFLRDCVELVGRANDIVDQMRIAIPQEVRDAREMVAQREELLLGRIAGRVLALRSKRKFSTRAEDVAMGVDSASRHVKARLGGTVVPVQPARGFGEFAHEMFSSK